MLIAPPATIVASHLVLVPRVMAVLPVTTIQSVRPVRSEVTRPAHVHGYGPNRRHIRHPIRGAQVDLTV